MTPPQPATAPVFPPHLSDSSSTRSARTSRSVMTQAGRGTGKSTVILERIKYLETCGVPASDITVLSFTNAAADNITEKNPNVGSMTIAKMIIDIYSMNHPTHKVSAIDTIINSIDIFYPNSQFAATFRHRLLEVDQNKTGAFTALNTFVENHFDEVIALLDRIEQTSLELQIIICYQKIDDMAEPLHVQSKYLIIDEVQDNSVFEFIYVLKYVTKHAQSAVHRRRRQPDAVRVPLGQPEGTQHAGGLGGLRNLPAHDELPEQSGDSGLRQRRARRTGDQPVRQHPAAGELARGAHGRLLPAEGHAQLPGGRPGSPGSSPRTCSRIVRNTVIPELRPGLPGPRRAGGLPGLRPP